MNVPTYIILTSSPGCQTDIGLIALRHEPLLSNWDQPSLSWGDLIQMGMYSNIVHNSLHHVYSFFLFFLIFWQYLHNLPYLEMCTDHVNSTPILSITVYIMSVLFSLFPRFSGYIYVDYHIRKCGQTMLTLLQHCQQQSVYSFFTFFQLIF